MLNIYLKHILNEEVYYTVFWPLKKILPVIKTVTAWDYSVYVMYDVSVCISEW